MALTAQQQASRLFKKSLGVAETITSKEFFSEAKLGNTAVLPSQIWSQADQISYNAPSSLTNGQTSGVTQRFILEPLTFISGSISGSSEVSYFSSNLIDAIPSNFNSGGSYYISLWKNDGTTPIFDGQGDWLVDTTAGVVTFYGTPPSGVASATPPKISFYKYVGGKGLASIAGDTSSLSTAVSTEISNRTSGDTSLSTAISTEVSLRTSVDSSLSSSSLQPWIDIQRSGFVDNSETTISFVEGTRTFTLAGTEWSYYRDGIKYTITGNKSVILPNTAGSYYITIDSSTGDLISGTTVWDIEDSSIPVATIRYNILYTPVYFMADERHTIAIDQKMHKYLHQTRGTQFISGGGLDGPTVQTATDGGVTFGVATTVIADEDLYQTLSLLTRPSGTADEYNIFYRTNTSTWAWDASEVPFRYTASGYIQYDNAGSMTQGSDAKFYNTYLLFTDLNANGRFSIVHGRGEFDSLSEARSENPLTFDWTGFPVAESLIGYQFTWATSTSRSNLGKVWLEAAPVKINISTTTIVASGAGTDHDTLSGLQGGTSNEYFHLTNADYIVATGISSTVSTEVSNRISADTSLSSALSTGLSGSSTALSTEISDRTIADTSLSNAISSGLSTEISVRTSVDATKLNLAGGTMTGNIDMGTNVITVTNAPTTDTQLANKAYVDAVAQGLYPHAPVLVVLTGQTILSGLLTVDGVALSVSDRVLVVGQTNKAQNGIFAASGGTWLRASDADGTPDYEVQTGDFVFVESGTVNASSGWVLGRTDSATPKDINVGVDTQEWFKMAAPGSYTTDGEGIDLIGNEFQLELDGTTLAKGASGLKVSDSLSTVISTNVTGISTEISDRASADSSLSTLLSTETSLRSSVDTSITTVLSTETSDRTSADTSLTTRVSTEEVTRLSVDNSLSTSLSTETSVRGSADTSLTTRVSTEEVTRLSVDNSLSHALSVEASTRASFDLSLSTSVNTVEDITTNLSSGELVYYNGTTLSGTTNLFPSLSTSISTLSSGSSGNVDSLSTALSTETSVRGSVDSSLSSALSIETSNRTSADTSLSTEVSTSILSGDQSLSTMISTLSSGSSDDIDSLSTGLSTETSSRSSVDSSLSSALSTETSNRTSDDTSLTTRVSTEEVTRSSVDSSLSSALSTETSNRTSDDTSLTSALSTETSSRSSVDSSLSSTLSTETSNRTSGDTSLTTRVSTEEVTRLSVDNSLSAMISTLSSGSTEDIDSLSTGLSTETSSRSSVDSSLSSALSTETSNRTSGDTSLTSALSTETSVRSSVDSSLSSALSTGLSIETSSRNSADSSLSSALSTNLSTETSVRSSTDSSLSSALSTEASTRLSVDATKLALAGGVMSGNIDMSTYQIIISGTPTSDYQVANKAYVDALAQGVSPHAPVRVVSITNITTSGLLTIDGVTLIEGDSVLVAGQTNKVQNGIFVASGSSWSRRPDADGDPDNEVELGDFVFVESGLTNASSGWVLGKTNSTDMPIDPGVETQEWYKMAAPGSYTTDGEGIELNGNIFSLELEGTTLAKGASGLKVSDSLSTVISTNTVGLSTEVSDRISVDESLSTSISTMSGATLEIDTIISDGELLGMVGSELSGITNIQPSLSTSLSTEISDRASADSSIMTELSTEISDRSSADTSLTTRVSNEESTRSSADTSLTTRVSNEESTRSSADSSIMTVINNLSGVTSQTAGSGLTYVGAEQALNVNVDGLTIKIINDTLVGTKQWIQLSTTTTVSGATSGNTGLVLTYDAVTPVSAYINGIEYLVSPGTSPIANYPFFYNAYPPVAGTQIWFDPITAGFDIISGVDVVVIKYLIIEE